MRISVSGTCRGSGKVYLRLIVDDTSDDKLELDAATQDGRSVPCSLYQMPASERDARRRYVAVFPDLSIGQCSYTIRQYDKSGLEVDTCTHRLSFTTSKWVSRLSYRFSQESCYEIRDYDTRFQHNTISIEYWECIPDEESVILRLAVKSPCITGDVRIFCYDDLLTQINVNPIILGDKVVPSTKAGYEPYRQVLASIRISNQPKRLVFVAKFSDEPHSIGFNVLDAPAFTSLRDQTALNLSSAQFNPAYSDWAKAHAASQEELASQAAAGTSWGPSFSIVAPLFRTPLDVFDEMVRSVTRQSYAKWELILVNASPGEGPLSEALDAFSNNDSRIKAITLAENLGISQNTKAGLEQATGDFVCFLDHDDTLEPNALFEYAQAIALNQDIDVLYCDEDKIDLDGRLTQPFFKPDFSIDLLRSFNYLCHFLAIRKSLLNQLQYGREAFDGAQDYNLVLQASERARSIHHVPHILYHWRMSASSTASNVQSKSYATDAGMLALNEHLKRLGVDATVTPHKLFTSYQVTYTIPDEHPLVSILIPSKDHIDVLDTCLKSILGKTSYDNYEIIIIENNSELDETFDYYQRTTERYANRLRVVYWPGEFNFSKLMNFGARHATGEYLLLLNNDTEVITPDWMSIMLGNCAREEVGIVGARLYYRDDTIQHAGVVLNNEAAHHLGLNIPRGQVGYFGLLDVQQNFSAVTAACLMTKKSVFEGVGGFTEELQVAFNDVDYCLKVREKGVLVVYDPRVELYHYESLSRGAEDNRDKQIRFHKEVSYLNYLWSKYFVLRDPYSNPNLAPGPYSQIL